MKSNDLEGHAAGRYQQDVSPTLSVSEFLSFFGGVLGKSGDTFPAPTSFTSKLLRFRSQIEDKFAKENRCLGGHQCVTGGGETEVSLEIPEMQIPSNT